MDDSHRTVTFADAVGTILVSEDHITSAGELVPVFDGGKTKAHMVVTDTGPFGSLPAEVYVITVQRLADAPIEVKAEVEPFSETP